MVYALLRAIAGVSLRWYYRAIHVTGMERIPRRGPLLLVVNHPNALVDALLVGWVMPRRVLITAKATLFANPIADVLLRWLGVLPLRRTSDERSTPEGQPLGAERNAETFRAVYRALEADQCILIFPEGKTPNEPSLAPLKTGAARMVLHAADGNVRGIAILPIGLVFERKDRPRSRVSIDIGEPILLDEWRNTRDASARSADLLTREIELRLRALTLNYPDADTAARETRLAVSLASLLEPREHVNDERGYAVEARIARRISELQSLLRSTDVATRNRAQTLVDRLGVVENEAMARGISLDDARIDLGRRSGLRFVLRESWHALFGGPVALWGRVNHWLPFRVARAIAMSNVESAADPAMRTIIAGTALVLLAYLAQTAVVLWFFGWLPAAVYFISLPIAADVNFSLTDRLRRAIRRARAYLLLRRDPEFRQRLAAELASLRADVMTFDCAINARDTPTSSVDQ